MKVYNAFEGASRLSQFNKEKELLIDSPTQVVNNDRIYIVGNKSHIIANFTRSPNYNCQMMSVGLFNNLLEKDPQFMYDSLSLAKHFLGQPLVLADTYQSSLIFLKKHDFSNCIKVKQNYTSSNGTEMCILVFSLTKYLQNNEKLKSTAVFGRGPVPSTPPTKETVKKEYITYSARNEPDPLAVPTPTVRASATRATYTGMAFNSWNPFSDTNRS
jgi:hypothetical protein